MIGVVRVILRVVAVSWLAVFCAMVVMALSAPAALADNCSVFTDCFGQSEAASEAALGLTALAALSLVIDFIGSSAAGAAAGLGWSTSGWDRALGLMRRSWGDESTAGGRGGDGGLFGHLSGSLNWGASAVGPVNHFFGTDVFDEDRWAGFIGDLAEGSFEIQSLFPASPANIHQSLTDPDELLDRYQSFGLGLWDFAKGTAVTAHDVSSLTPTSPGFFVEMHRYSETGEHRGLALVSGLAEAGSGLSSLSPGSPEFYRELHQVAETGSIADHEGLQNGGRLVVGVLDWETFQQDPSRWFGRVTGEVALDVATGGVARGVGVSDNVVSAAGRATDVADPALARRADAAADGVDGPTGGRSVDEDGARSVAEAEVLDPAAGSAVVEPEVTNNLARSSAGDPVDLASGAVFIPVTDVALPGVLPLVLRRTHLSSYRSGGLFGSSWASTLDEHLVVEAERVLVAGESGERLQFAVPGPGERVSSFGGRPLELIRDEDGAGWTVYEPATGLRRVFQAFESPAVARLVAIGDRAGNRIDVERDGAGLPTAVVHSGGYRIAVDVDGEIDGGRIRSLNLIADDGRETPIRRFSYDDAGLLAAVADPGAGAAPGPTNGLAGDGQVAGRGVDVGMRYFYDTDGRVVRWRDRNGTEYGYRYDELGRCVEGSGTDGILTSGMVYEPGRTTVTNSLSEVQVFEFNQRGQTVRHVDAEGRVVESAWDEFDRPAWRRDPLGRVTLYQYDADGNLVAVEAPGGRRFEMAYAGPGLVSELVFPDGARWLTEYDGAGNAVRSTDPTGAETTFGYAPTGGLAWVRDPTGRTTSYATDRAGLISSVTSPTGAVTTVNRDRFGRAAAVVNPVGGVTQAEYTVQGWLRRLVDADGGVQEWVHDGEGNLSSHTDAMGRVTGYEHTPFDQVAAVVRPDGSRNELTHDTEGRVVGAVDAMGRSWVYELDGSGHVVTETDINGRSVRYERDDLGRVEVRTNASGQVVRYRYDDAGDLRSKEVDGAPVEYDYDGAGRLVATRTDGVDHRVERDGAGRVVAESWNGLTVRFSYDEAGRRVGQVSAAGLRSDWRYGDDGGLVELSTAGRSVGFSRDNAGREVGRRLGGSAVLEQAWSAGDRLLSQRIDRVDGGGVQERAYSYNSAGELTGLDDVVRGRHRFELDPLGRIAARVVDQGGVRSTEEYRYDPTGMISAASGLDSVSGAGVDDRWDLAGSMVRRAGRDTFGHDRDGRVVFRRRKRLSQAAAVWRFEWDGEDRLVGLVTPDGDRWRYLYDGVGRRVAKQRFGSDGAVVSQVWFVWDGFQVVEELSFGGEGRVERASSWCWDPVSGVPVSQVDMLARVGDAGSQEWYDRQFYSIVSDLVGAASELIGEDGSLAWAPTRSVWGEDRDGGSQGAVQCPWGFAGQYNDEESGLHYNVHRYYDPATGGFLSPDPVGASGGLNPHASVPNPTGWVDPLGLTPCSPQPSGPNTPSGLSPSSIRFSQSSVNNVDEIAGSMRANGWVGDPIDVVRMPDGSLATLDNTRVLAAHQAGIDVQATVRAFDDPLTTEMAERFATAKGGMPSTWGEAITNRIGNQNAGYRTAWPDGSPFTGWSGN